MSTSTATTRSAPNQTPVASKAAILILSDPASGSEEALGRVFNALAAAYDYKARGRGVQIIFSGAGTRWIARLEQADHPAHGLWKEVRDRVAGVSCGCADSFGGREDAERSGFDLITSNPVPNTSGLPSLSELIDDGHAVLTF